MRCSPRSGNWPCGPGWWPSPAARLPWPRACAGPLPSWGSRPPTVPPWWPSYPAATSTRHCWPGSWPRKRRPTIGSAMRTGLAYTSARILLLVISVVLLYLAGARGILLLALAFVISALASYVLLSRQREVLAGALNRRLGRVTAKATEFRQRIDEGAAAEDEDNTAGEPANAETSG